jgi:hypothetical protein
MRILRITLGFVGVIGFAIWLILSALAWLFDGFKAGGAQGGLSTWQNWLCALAPAAAFIYYAWIAAFPWTRRIFIIGGVLHLILLLAVVTLVTFTDGGFVTLPALSVGPALWIIYAIRTQDSDRVA